MLLQDKAIIERLLAEPERRIVITPLIDPKQQIGPSSVDVRLGNSFRVPATSHIGAIDPHDEAAVTTYTSAVEIRHRDEFYLHPGEFVLAATLEYLRVPRDLACRIEGRSSWGRLGLLVHATAGFVDPGFSGNLTFELFNAGRLPVRLRPGMRMAQLCFFELKDKPNVAYDQRPESKYDKSLSAGGSQVWRDRPKSAT
jgi:dCTP deaminase